MYPGLAPLSLLGSLMLVGCVTTADQENRWVFTCPDGYEFTAEYSAGGGSVVLQDENRQLKLNRERSASGALYTDGETVFWNKGVMARVELGGADNRVVHQDCQGVSD